MEKKFNEYAVKGKRVVDGSNVETFSKQIVSCNIITVEVGTTGLPDFSISKDCMLFLYDIEKQGEHKPTDKVEPKFKVGDWVIFNNHHESIY